MVLVGVGFGPGAGPIGSSGVPGVGSLGGGFGERLVVVRNRRLGRLSLPRRGRRDEKGGGRMPAGVWRGRVGFNKDSSGATTSLRKMTRGFGGGRSGERVRSSGTVDYMFCSGTACSARVWLLCLFYF